MSHGDDTACVLKRITEQLVGVGHTDIDRDGVMKGINWDSTIELAEAVSIPVIASGGLASMDDIRRLASPECNALEGAISGRALYDAAFDIGAALKVLEGST